MKKSMFVLPLLFTLASCGEVAEHKLVGVWQCVSILENGMPLDVNPDEIRFQFTEAGLYSFHSTLNYKEAGTFKIDGDLLYTLDTLNSASSEKAVQLSKFTNDSLMLKMLSDGKERLLKLVRK